MFVLQAACLSVCQYLTASKETFDEELEESDSDSEVAPYQSSPPVAAPPPAAPSVPTVIGKTKPKKAKAAIPPPLPEVTRIMEMGFQRKQVEFAIKSLG